MTKEERFLIFLHKLASERGDLYCPIDRYTVGEMVGLHTKGIDTTCNVLAQVNFIKKVGPTQVALTPHGEALVLKLKG